MLCLQYHRYWKRKLDGADGYDLVAPQYGMQFQIKANGRNWKGKYAFDVYSEIWTNIETYVDDIKKFWNICGFTNVKDPASSNIYSVLVEVPFYQTKYVVQSKLRFKDLKSQAIVESIASPDKMMMMMAASTDKKYDQEFIAGWLSKNDLSSDDSDDE